MIREANRGDASIRHEPARRTLVRTLLGGPAILSVSRAELRRNTSDASLAAWGATEAVQRLEAHCRAAGLSGDLQVGRDYRQACIVHLTLDGRGLARAAVMRAAVGWAAPSYLVRGKVPTLEALKGGPRTFVLISECEPEHQPLLAKGELKTLPGRVSHAAAMPLRATALGVVDALPSANARRNYGTVLTTLGTMGVGASAALGVATGAVFAAGAAAAVCLAATSLGSAVLATARTAEADRPAREHRKNTELTLGWKSYVGNNGLALWNVVSRACYLAGRALARPFAPKDSVGR